MPLKHLQLTWCQTTMEQKKQDFGDIVIHMMLAIQTKSQRKVLKLKLLWMTKHGWACLGVISMSWWVWMQSVKDMKGNTWMKMTFFLYLNVEIKTFLLLFRVNKMLLLTSACDFSFVNTMWTYFVFTKKGFNTFLKMMIFIFSFVSWFPVVVCFFFSSMSANNLFLFWSAEINN